jgi:hypothetical protein
MRTINTVASSLFIAGVLFFSGCASTPKVGRGKTDAQCSSFKSALRSCLPEYDSIDRLTELARCESGCRADARAPAGYIGAFQYSKKTWAYACYPIFEKKHLGHCKNTKAMTDLCCASTCSSEMISAGGIGHWPNCGKKF